MRLAGGNRQTGRQRNWLSTVGMSGTVSLGLVIAGCSSDPGGSGDTAAATPLERGKAYYTTCAGCHGNNGEGIAAMHAPRLAGMDSEYLERQLLHYRADIRGSAADFYGVMMNGRAKALGEDDQAVSDVVAYIATLPEPKYSVSASSFEAGREHYATCVACHGERAEGNKELNAPSLIGLEKDYLVRQLTNYRNDVRGAHPDDTLGAQMKVSALVLEDDQAVEEVSEFIASLNEPQPSPAN